METAICRTLPAALVTKDISPMKVEVFVDGICEQVVYYFRDQRPYTYDEMKEGLLACTREAF